jgi:DNA-binding PadR family transcriptional regulator
MHPAFKTHSHHRAHGPFGRGGGGGGRHGRGDADFSPHERRRERMFESGDIKLLVLHILRQQPSHGYDIIRVIGELVGGDYTPSPGTIYPALTYLEDLGHIQAIEQDGGRKRYQITPQGETELQSQEAAVQAVLKRLEHVRLRQAGHRPPELVRAMENLKTAMRLKFGTATPDAQVVQRIAAVIDQAALDIERL